MRARIWSPPERELSICGAGAGAGFGASPWTPAALSPVLWGGQGVVTYAAQPVLVNGDFSQWSGDNPTGWPVPIGETGTNYVTQDANGARVRCAAGGQMYMIQGGHVLGNRYQFVVNVPVVTSGKVSIRNQIQIGLFATPGVHIAEGTATTGFVEIWRGDGAVENDFVVRSIAATNLSLTTYTPQIGAALAQAVPTAMPWVDPVTGLMRVQGGDHLVSAAAASTFKGLHSGAATLIIVVKPVTVTVGNNVLAYTSDTATTDVGCLFAFNPNAAVVYIMNGSGTAHAVESYPGGAPAVAGDTYVYTLRVGTGANNVTVRQNGVNVLTATLNSPSAADPGHSLKVGGVGLDAFIRQPFYAPRVLTDAECLQAERYEYQAFTGSPATW